MTTYTVPKKTNSIIMILDWLKNVKPKNRFRAYKMMNERFDIFPCFNDFSEAWEIYSFCFMKISRGVG